MRESTIEINYPEGGKTFVFIELQLSLLLNDKIRSVFSFIFQWDTTLDDSTESCLLFHHNGGTIRDLKPSNFMVLCSTTTLTTESFLAK